MRSFLFYLIFKTLILDHPFEVGSRCPGLQCAKSKSVLMMTSAAAVFFIKFFTDLIVFYILAAGSIGDVKSMLKSARFERAVDSFVISRTQIAAPQTVT